MAIKNIYVIIVSYNGMRWYERCFSSLRDSVIPLHVVVVDNASTDGTVDYIQKKFPDIELICMDSNAGFGKANNIGIDIARQNHADYVFLLNQDTWVESDTFLKLIDVHQKNPEFGIISPIHLNAEKSSIEKGLLTYLSEQNELLNDLYFGELKELYPVRYVNAASWLIPINVIDIVGGFDPLFFHYGEDDNYMHRVSYYGYKIGVCPRISIIHDTQQRVTTSEKTTQSDTKYLLVKLTDVNNQTPLLKYVFWHFRKSVLKFCSLKFKASISYFAKAYYICSMRNKIEASKTQNRKKGPSWLSL